MAKNSTYILSGNTYEHRRDIARIGGKWDAVRKAWIVKAGNMHERQEQSSVIHALRNKNVEVEEQR